MLGFGLGAGYFLRSVAAMRWLVNAIRSVRAVAWALAKERLDADAPSDLTDCDTCRGYVRAGDWCETCGLQGPAGKR
jgi:hypothetical protein